MIRQAAEEHDIDLKSSWMIGDSHVDIKAGADAGCKTIFVGSKKCYIWEKMEVEPDYVVPNLYEASLIIKKELEVKND